MTGLDMPMPVLSWKPIGSKGANGFTAEKLLNPKTILCFLALKTEADVIFSLVVGIVNFY